MRLPPSLPPCLLIGALLLAGCTDSAPDRSSGDVPDAAAPAAPSPDAFRDGTCRLVADDVLALGRDGARLGEGPTVPTGLRAALRESAARLSAAAETAEPEVKAPLDRLLVATGLVRIRADSNSYEPQLGEAMRAAYDQAVVACTSPASPTGALPSTSSSPSSR